MGGGAQGERLPRPPRPEGPVTILHNPKCSTSRKVLARLREVGLDPIVVDYLANPPSALQLVGIAIVVAAGAAAQIGGRRRQPAVCCHRRA